MFLAAAVIAVCIGGCGYDAQKELDLIFRQRAFSGVVRAVKDGKTVCEKAEGTLNPQTGESIGMDTLFCVGSVSKQIAAAAVMLLKEQGRLRVEDTLGKYYPDCAYGSLVTLKDLLTQRSGIAEFYEVEDDGSCYNELPAGEMRGVITNEQSAEDNRRVLTDWLLSQPLEFEPGSMYVYTNSNYFLLTGIIEQAAQKPYESFVKENIFKKLGMSSSGFIDEMLGSPLLAQSPVEARTVYVGITRGLGDVISNAHDMELWMNSFADKSLLTEDSIKEMTTDYCNEADGTTYGYGIKPDNRGGLFHTGFFTTYCALVYFNPEKHYTFFAVTNDKNIVQYNIKTMFWDLIVNTM